LDFLGGAFGDDLIGDGNLFADEAVDEFTEGGLR
jgi:hypothetical protein